MDRFLERGYDVICVNIVDRTAAAVIVDKAQAAGVPVIFFNREPVEEDLRRWKHAYYVSARQGRRSFTG
ncbi:MAG: substrate-binding domain-containing protein [Dysosmobacter sp.]